MRLGGDGGVIPFYASKSYMEDQEITGEEVFEEIVASLCGNEMTTDLSAFYEKNIKGKGDTAELVYLDREGHRRGLVGYYQVEDSVMEFSYLSMDAEGELSLSTLNYDVVFENGSLMVSEDGITGKLPPDMGDSLHHVGGYASDPSDMASGIYRIDFGVENREEAGFSLDSGQTVGGDDVRATVYFADGYRTQDNESAMGPGNRLETSWNRLVSLEDAQEKEESGSLTAYYLDCGDIGCILRVDGRDYFYQKTEKEYYAGLVGDSVVGAEVETEVLEKMAAAKREMLRTMQEAIQEKFAGEGYIAEEAVTIDENTGKITLADYALFDGDGYELSEEGKTYLSLLFFTLDEVGVREGYEDYLDEIIVSVYTDAGETYEANQELSEARADAVDDYCYDLYLEMAMSAEIDTAGYASDPPTGDADGNEDKDASGRVEIMITLDVDAFTDLEE